MAWHIRFYTFKRPVQYFDLNTEEIAISTIPVFKNLVNPNAIADIQLTDNILIPENRLPAGQGQ